MTSTVESLVRIAMTNPVNAELADRLPKLGLNQCMLTAGCLFQAVWNHQSQRPPAWGVKDYDVFYFDDDLSWEAENEVIQSARHLFNHLDVNVEFKNQARVHLWYSQRFGGDYPQLQSARDGIDRYLIAGTCMGLDIETGEVYAPNGRPTLSTDCLESIQKTPDQTCSTRRRTVIRFAGLGSGS